MRTKRREGKLFTFCVTMRNHGGYDESTLGDFVSTVKLNYQKSYPLAETDQAFEKLVDYFKDRDEKAMIVMFGNQLPAIENKFYEELFGKKISNLDLPEECSEALKEYEILQYNNIFDKTNLVSDIE